MNQRINSLVLACGAALIAVGLQALGQNNAEPPPPEATPAPAEAPVAPSNVGDGLLSGPKVGDESKQPQERERMRARAAERGMRGDFAGAMRLWYATLQQVGLTDEQKQQIEPIRAEYLAAVETYVKENGEKLPAIREQFRAARQNGTEMPKEAAQEFKKLRELAPKAEPYQEKIWALLTPEQQKLFTEKREAAEKLARERGMNRSRPGEDGMQPGGNPDDPAAKERRARREQLRKEREQQNPSEPGAPADPAPVEPPAAPASPGGSNQTS